MDEYLYMRNMRRKREERRGERRKKKEEIIYHTYMIRIFFYSVYLNLELFVYVYL